LIANDDQNVNRNLRPDFVRKLRQSDRMTNSDPIALQLRNAREEVGLSMREMARRLGVSPNTYRHYEDPELFKSKYLPLDLAKKLAAAVEDRRFSIRVAYLAGLDGTFSEVVEENQNLIRIENEDAQPADRDLVPVYEVQASAGHGSIVSEEKQEFSLAFPPRYLETLTSSNPRNLSIISVKGESMEPTLVDNDIVLLDMSKTNLSYDGLFVIRFDDALHVKRVGRSPKKGHITIISDNKDLYPPMEAAIADIEPVGKVLWCGRKV
jgi:phage repressor protein C with HTH and peptisase S24 domain